MLTGTELKIDLLDLTDLALATFKIPDVNDMTGRLPPSQHKTMAKRVLLVCSKVGEPSAILHIMKAVYLKRSDPIAQDIASHFTAPEIATCRRDLEKLAAKEDPDAMTLLGQFLEVEGRKQEARKLYECALELKDTRYSQGAQNPTGLPQVAPWNALAELLRKEKDSASQAQAKAALEKGAFKADDPVAYLSLATMYEDDPKNIDLWLESASKAAASGSLDAMYAVGILHLTAFENGKPRLLPKYQQSKKFTNSMSWLTRQNKFRPTDLAVEWFQVAANLGHKPSMAKLVDICKNAGKMEDTFSWLQVLANPPEDRKEEQWPELTAKARMDLSQLRSHPSFNSAAAAQAWVKDQ
jgi:tetratricopeptide (TPR) repeat protein